MHDLSPPEAADLPVAEDVVIAYVGGGSLNWGSELMNDVATCEEIAGEIRLYDVDNERANANAELGNLYQRQAEATSDFEYVAVRDMETAFDGADFVLTSTRFPREQTVADTNVPREHGIYHTIGDTVGPGGAFRAMRAIPLYREIAATVRDQCPDAWVINHTNPMTVVTRTLYEEYPEINAMGLCHEVFQLQRVFAELIEDHLAVESARWTDVDLNVKGINHFTWVDEAHWRGRDVFGLIDRRLEDRPPAPSWEPGALDGHRGRGIHDVTYDLYDRFGVLPCAGDRHLAEFVPWYLSDPEQAERWGTPVRGHAEGGSRWERQNERRAAMLAGEEPIEIRDSQEDAVDIMCALAGGTPHKTNANSPNIGQCGDLRRGAVVETNHLFTGGSMKPLAAGTLPDPVTNTVSTHVDNQETLVEAGFAGDLDLAYRAVLNDPLVTIQPDEAASMFREMVLAERPLLEEDWNVESAAVMAGAAPSAAGEAR